MVELSNKISNNFMDKIMQIRDRILEHKSELKRLYELPEETRANKFVKQQVLDTKKAIQKLTGRFAKIGGNVKELEDKIEVDNAPSTKQKTKRGKKTK